MSKDYLGTTNIEQMARFLQNAEASGPVWSKEELAAILCHQLSTPLEFDLGGRGRGQRREGVAGPPCGQPGIATFADLFTHPQPPIELLESAKSFAKASRSHHDRPLPPEVSTFLYYASIAAAMVRCGRRISELTDEALREGFTWCTKSRWTAIYLEPLFNEAIKLLAKDAPS